MATRATVIGIDLGTTCSCVAVFKNGRIVANDQGDCFIPSFVSFTDTRRCIGDEAKSKTVINPTNTIFGVKRLIGLWFDDGNAQADRKLWPFKIVNEYNKPKMEVEYKCETLTFSPEEILAMILNKIKQICELRLGERITDVVITVPAHFNRFQRQSIEDAGTIAGLNVLRLTTSSAAAALNYGFMGKTSNRILIYDLGGSNVEVTIVTMEDGICNVNATVGDTRVGGEDFDNRLVSYFIESFSISYRRSFSSNPRALSRLRKECARAKHELSSSRQSSIQLEENVQFSITRDTFEEICSDLFQRATSVPIKRALQDANLEKTDIDEIILVGGSSRIPKIRQLLKEFFNGKELNTSINPDEASARGAAILAAILRNINTPPLNSLCLRDVTRFAIGIETVGGFMTSVITRNTPIPVIETKVFAVHHSNVRDYPVIQRVANSSSVSIQVYEGDRTMVKDNCRLGAFELTEIPPSTGGVFLLKITFEIDAKNNVRVTAALNSNGGCKKQVNFTCDRKECLSKAEVERMTQDANRYAREDEEEGRRIDARNELESCCYNMEQRVRDDEYSASERRAVLDKCQEIVDWLSANQLADKEEYIEKMEEIQSALLTTRVAVDLGRHTVEMEPRILLARDAGALKECLEKQCAGLTSNRDQQDMTAEETLLLCLVQHFTGQYHLQSLDYRQVTNVVGNEFCTESKWNKMRSNLPSYHNLLTVTSVVNTLIQQVVEELSITLNWNLTSTTTQPRQICRIVCYGVDRSPVEYHVKYSTSPSQQLNQLKSVYHVWYDQSAKCFESITCLSDLFPSWTSYWQCLLIRAENCLDSFFQRELADFILIDQDHGKLEARAVQLCNQLVATDSESIDSLMLLFSKWETGKELEYIVKDMRYCCTALPSTQQPIETSPARCYQELWQLAVRCLVRQVELTFIEQTRRIEMSRRQTDEQMDKIQDKVDELNSEITQARQRLSDIDKRILNSKVELLSWNQLLLDLANVAIVPDYKLALAQDRNHALFKIEDPRILAGQIFDLIYPASNDRESSARIERKNALIEYIRKRNDSRQVLQELRSALDTFSGATLVKSAMRNNILSITGGSSVVLSLVVAKYIKPNINGDQSSSCSARRIQIKADRIIYLDCDLKIAGISLDLSAPSIHVIADSRTGRRTIDTSGKNAKPLAEPKAADGTGPGLSGSHGLDGDAGEDAGDLTINCRNFVGHGLDIIARGGNGADGQDGGNGVKGQDGHNGSDGATPTEKPEGYFSKKLFIYSQTQVYSNSGWAGKPGGPGGSGGNAGKGGRGGLGGQIRLSIVNQLSDLNQRIKQDTSNGKNGKNGRPGQAAPGGSGGEDGRDTFLYFDPDDDNPIFKLTGYYRIHRGSRDDLEAVPHTGWLEGKRQIGSRLKSNWRGKRMSRATEGKRGTEGNRAAEQNQQEGQRERSDGSASQEDMLRQSQESRAACDANQNQLNSEFAAQRRNQEERQRQARSINKLSAEISYQEKEISSHERILTEHCKRLEKIAEIRKRVLVKIQETLDQRVVQRTAASQRVSRQMKFKGQEDPLTSPVPSNIRGPTANNQVNRVCRPSSGDNSASALRCLSFLDPLLVSPAKENHLLLKLGQAVQLLILELSLDQKHEIQWSSIERIIKNTKQDLVKLTESLEWIASSIQLIITANEDLITKLHQFLATINPSSQLSRDAVSLFHEFQQSRLTFPQVFNLIQSLPVTSSSRSSKNDDWILFRLLLDQRLLSLATEKIQKCLNQPASADLMAKYWLRCSPTMLASSSDKDVNSTSSGVEESPIDWFQHVSKFIDSLEDAQKKPSISTNPADEKLVFGFVRQRLFGPKFLLSSFLPTLKSQEEDRWKLDFFIEHLAPTLAELNEIGRWASNELDRDIIELVERSFNEQYASPLWRDIHKFLDPDVNQKSQPHIPVSKDDRKCINRLQTACQSPFTHLRFDQRLQWGEELKRALPKVKFQAISEWLQKQSKQAELYTSSLVVPKSTAREEAEVIVDMVKQQVLSSRQYNGMADWSDPAGYARRWIELNYRLSCHDVTFVPKQIGDLAEVLLDRSTNWKDTDDATVRYHRYCFTSAFVENWTSYLSLHWEESYKETDTIREEVRHRETETSSSAIDTLDLALERYSLYTTCLPPLEAVQKWQKLKTMNSKDIIKLIAGDLKQASQDIEKVFPSTINGLQTTLKLSKSGKKTGNSFVDVVDDVLEVICNTTEIFYCDTDSVKKLVALIEKLETIVDLMHHDIDSSDKNWFSKKNQPLVTTRIGEWRKRLDQWQSGQSSSVRIAIHRLIDSLSIEAKKSSPVGDNDGCSKKIYDRIAAHRQNILENYDQSVSWLMELVGYLTDPRSGMNVESVIKATIPSCQSLSWTKMGNEENLIRATMKILTCFTSGTDSETVLPDLSWHSVFGKMLDLQVKVVKQHTEEHDAAFRKIWLVATLADFVAGRLKYDSLRRSDWTEMKVWLSRLSALIENYRLIMECTNCYSKLIDTTGQAGASSQIYRTDVSDAMVRVQQALMTCGYACYRSKLMSSNAKINEDLVNFTFKDAIERWTMVVQFVTHRNRSVNGQHSPAADVIECQEIMDRLTTRQLIIEGMIKLGQSPSDRPIYLDQKTINTFLIGQINNGMKDFAPSCVEEMKILSLMLNGKLRPWCRALIERWMSMQSSWDRERLDKLKKVLTGWAESNGSKRNALTDSALFKYVDFDFFTEEEISYTDLIEKGWLEVLIGCSPSSFSTKLQKLAIQRIRATVVRCFEPSLTDEDIERCVGKRLVDKTIGSPEGRLDHIVFLCQSFDQLMGKIKNATRPENEMAVVLDWLIWLRDVVVPSLNSHATNPSTVNGPKGLSVYQLINFFEVIGNKSLDVCRNATTSGRPHSWIDLLAIIELQKILHGNSSQLILSSYHQSAKGYDGIINKLLRWWPSGSGNMDNYSSTSSIFYLLHQKILQEMDADEERAGPSLIQQIQILVEELISLDPRSLQSDEDILGRFSSAPLKDWSVCIRYARLASEWSPSLATLLTNGLDSQLGSERTDRFLKLFCAHHPTEKISHDLRRHRLELICRHLIRYPWIKEQLTALIDASNNSANQPQLSMNWTLLSDSEAIEKEMASSSQVDLTVEDILDAMAQDAQTSKVFNNQINRMMMIQRMKVIRQLYTSKYKTWSGKDILDWVKKIKNLGCGQNKLQVEEFLSVACRVVQQKEGYLPRDVQLIAVMVFVWGEEDANQCWDKMPRRMGQISTGEGKTLISALVAIYHALRHWNRDRHVNIITSSSVLADANVVEIQWLYNAFGISVGNNCDQVCSKDDAIRRERYNLDVLYGDLGSFMRDLLLTDYLDKDIIRNRRAGALIVDEVDSMLLDKGENILYMSHNVPEMYDLMPLFVDIWAVINGPDVLQLAESGDIVQDVFQMIQPMVDHCVPKYLKDFAERHLSTWIESAFRARYLLKPNDAYKVDDVGDGRGKRIIIMDKETGVEQVETEWSDGLQQFLQLKHGLKWTPIALRAIYMSNIGFFSQFDGRIYGLTGTLGSEAECELLNHAFGVQFFRVPRFKRRFCIHRQPVVALNRQNWLDQIREAVKFIVTSQKRAVLIVCENIEAADQVFASVNTLKTSAEAIEVVKFVSSFDETFKSTQTEKIRPGQVMVATNLAGRGTDLKPNDQLLKNGGLHVIVSFMPTNARIEAQAEGRTARAGQPGSFQFIIEPTANDHQPAPSGGFLSSDSYSQLCQLKMKRDEQERNRLEHIRQKALPKIKLEDQLFRDFHKECLRYLPEKKSNSCGLREDQQTRIIRLCLTNRWALWLEEHAGIIEKSADPVLRARLRDDFDRLTRDASSSVLMDMESIVTSPSEMMILGRAYEDVSKRPKADYCYQLVINKEPLWSENALLDRARLELADDADHPRKIRAKVFLKQVRERIRNRIDSLNRLTQKVNECLNQQSIGEEMNLSHKRFEEQINNHIRVWRTHASAVDQLLGVSLKSALAASIEDDSKVDQVINHLLKKGNNELKPFHFSKSTSVKSNPGVQQGSTPSTTTRSLYRGNNPIDWPPFVTHCLDPLLNFVETKTARRAGRNITLSEIEEVICKSERHLWSRLVGVYVDPGQPADKIMIIEPHAAASFSHLLAEIPKKSIIDKYRKILPGWLKDHAGEDFSRVCDTLGIEDTHQLNALRNWLTERKMFSSLENCRRHRILKPIPSMADDVEAQLVEGVPLSSCADAMASWFSSANQRDGGAYVFQPFFDKRKKELAKQFIDYLIDFGIVKEPVLKFPFVNRSRDEITKGLDNLKTWLNGLRWSEEFAQLAPAVFGEKDETGNDLEKKKAKLVKALTDAIDPHLGQLKTLSKVKSSYSSLYTALPPSDGQSSMTDEIHQFNERHLDRVLKVDEYVSRWDWRIGVIALFGVIQLAGALAFPFFSSGLIGEGLNDLMFAFQSLTSPGSFSWKSYFVDKATSMAISVVSMGLGAARLVKACGKGGLKQAAKLMFRFNSTFKVWLQIGKQILVRAANMISSTIIGQAVNRFLTWLNKFILEKVLERVKSFLFNNPIFSAPFVKMRELMRSIMKTVVESGQSAAEASRKIEQALAKARESSSSQDWQNEFRDKASKITNRMLNIFNDSSAGLGNLQSSLIGDVAKKAASGNTKGITSGVDAGTVGKAIKLGATVIDYSAKAAKVVNQINTVTTQLESTFRLATHGSIYVSDLNSALQDELRSLKAAKKQTSDDNGKHQSKQQTATPAESKRFDEFVAKTESEIQSSIMKHALDTIQTTWVEPYVQRKVEKHVSETCSKLVQKYCPSLLPEGANNLKDNSVNDDNSGDETYDQMVDGMGEGKPAGPVTMQSAVDSRNFILDIEDETGEYTKGSDDKNFVYYPEGNPNSDAPRVKVKFTADPVDGTKHVTLIMPDGSLHDFETDPSKPNRCVFDAISKGLNDPSTDHTIQTIKDHAKDNDRTRCMHELGIDKSYKHLHAGFRKKPIHLPGGAKVTEDVHGRVGSYERTTTKNQQGKTKRDPKTTKSIKEEMDFLPGEDYGHIDAVSTGGPDMKENIARMKRHCNRKTFRQFERDLDSFKKANPDLPVTMRVETIYKHKSHEITRMRRLGQEFPRSQRYDALGFKCSFYLPDDPSNHYSKFIENSSKPKRSDRSVPPDIRGDMFTKHFQKKP